MPSWKPFAAALLLAAPAALQAQDEAGRIGVGGGVAEYDLSGTGTTEIFTLRVGAPLGTSVGWEVGISYLAPGDGVEVFLPEAQLQIQRTWGFFTPYLGLGAGAAIAATKDQVIGGVEFEGVTDSDFAPSASLGARLALSPAAFLFAEGRLHGVEVDFTGTIAELVGGIGFAW